MKEFCTANAPVACIEAQTSSQRFIGSGRFRNERAGDMKRLNGWQSLKMEKKDE